MTTKEQQPTNGTNKVRFVLNCVTVSILVLSLFGTIFFGWTAKDFALRDTRIERVECDVATIQAKLDRIESAVNDIKIVVTKEK